MILQTYRSFLKYVRLYSFFQVIANIFNQIKYALLFLYSDRLLKAKVLLNIKDLQNSMPTF